MEKAQEDLALAQAAFQEKTAEVDINKIQPGHVAMITSEYKSFEGELKGTVDNIGLQVGRKQT